MEEGKFKTFDSRGFVNDPVRFGALMDFQYGESEVSREEAERLLFEEENKGLAVEQFDTIGEPIKDISFWITPLDEKEREPKRFRLYANERPASRLGANLLDLAGVDFELVQSESSTLNVNGRRKPLPILVDLAIGVPHETLVGVREFARQNLFDEKLKVRYYPNPSTYSPSVIFPQVRCFSSEGEQVFVGDIDKAPVPLREALSWNWYAQRTNGGGFHHIYGWNLGEWEKIAKSPLNKGTVTFPKAPAALFFDEVEALKDGEQRLVLNESGNMYQVQYDTYFINDGNLFRVYAEMSD